MGGHSILCKSPSDTVSLCTLVLTSANMCNWGQKPPAGEKDNASILCIEMPVPISPSIQATSNTPVSLCNRRQKSVAGGKTPHRQNHLKENISRRPRRRTSSEEQLQTPWLPTTLQPLTPTSWSPTKDTQRCQENNISMCPATKSVVPLPPSGSPSLPSSIPLLACVTEGTDCQRVGYMRRR